MITVFPERALSPVALVVLLRSASGNQLHALRNNGRACVLHQKMKMIGCHHVVEAPKDRSASWPRTPNAGNGAGHAQTLVKISFDGSDEWPLSHLLDIAFIFIGITKKML